MLILILAVAVAEPDFATAIVESKRFTVRYEASLGEGDGAFDPRSRTVINEVNCMTWLQWVLARAYAPDKSSMQSYLDAVRYYDSTVAFSHRKHYIDRWVALDPAPLKVLQSPQCTPDILSSVQLDLMRFKKNQKYSSTLYQEEKDNFTVEALNTDRMTGCLSSLEKGYYVLFFVGNEAYLERWGQHGAMGLTHSMILERREDGTSVVHHASIDFGKVHSEDWLEISQRLSFVAVGWALFGLEDSVMKGE